MSKTSLIPFLPKPNDYNTLHNQIEAEVHLKQLENKMKKGFDNYMV